VSERAPIELLMDKAGWKELPQPHVSMADDPDALYATHEAVLEIGAATLRCYQLNDGQRVFGADDVGAFFTPAPIPDPAQATTPKDPKQ